MPKIEVKYFPQPNCSGNLSSIVVEATDFGAAEQIVMAMFQIPRSNIYAVNFYCA